MKSIYNRLSRIIKFFVTALLGDIENQLKHTNPSGANHARLLEMRKGIWSLLQNTALVATSTNER